MGGPQLNCLDTVSRFTLLNASTPASTGYIINIAEKRSFEATSALNF